MLVLSYHATLTCVHAGPSTTAGSHCDGDRTLITGVANGKWILWETEQQDHSLHWEHELVRVSSHCSLKQGSSRPHNPFFFFLFKSKYSDQVLNFSILTVFENSWKWTHFEGENERKKRRGERKQSDALLSQTKAPTFIQVVQTRTQDTTFPISKSGWFNVLSISLIHSLFSVSTCSKIIHLLILNYTSS